MAATAATSLTVIDRFSNVLNAFHQGVNQAAGSAIHLNQILQNHVTMNINVSNTVNQLQQVTVQAKEAASAIDSTQKSTGKLSTGLKSISKAFGGLKTAKQLVKLTIGGAMEEAQQKDMLKARAGNDQVGAAMFEKFKADALHAGTDVKGTINSVSAFIPVSKNSNQLSQFENIVQRLNAFDTTGQGVKGATTAVSKALSGDTGSLADNFNINKSQISAMKLDTYAKAGDVDGFLNAFNQLLEKEHMGKEEFAKMLDSPAKKWESVVNSLKASFAGAGQGALQALTPLLDMLSQGFQSGKFQPFFDLLNAALYGVGALLTFIVGLVVSFGNIAAAVFPYVAEGILVVGGALLTFYGIANAASIAQSILKGIMTAYSATLGFVRGMVVALNLAMSENPIALVIAVVVGLILAFLALIAALKPVRDFVAQVFRMLGNIISAAVGWYIDMWTGFINLFIDSLNLLLSGVNAAVGAIGNLLGIKTNIDLHLDHIDTSKFKSAIQGGVKSAFNKAADVTENFSLDNIKATLGLDALTKKADPNKNTDALNNWKNNVGNMQIQQVGSVGSVGKIDDKVDVSSEDLKVMRDLAEMKAVQNFVTLTPTLQVTTGDLHEKVDVDEMIHRIGDRMESAISSSAEGVFI